MLVLAILLIICSFIQFQDAFGFQHEWFKESAGKSPATVKSVSKYRETIIVCDTFYAVASFRLCVYLPGSILLIVLFNYLIIKVYDELSTVFVAVIISLVPVLTFVLKSVLNYGAASEKASVGLLRSFQIGKKNRSR
jgi:hypothetical protein